MWRLSRDWIAGALLVLVGLLLLAERQARALVPFIPLAAGVCLLAVSFVVRWPGLLVSAGALIGVGLGVLMARGSDPQIAAAAFLVCVGCGLLVAWILGVLLRLRELRWRPLLAGSSFVAAGVVVYALGIGPTLLELTVGWWPVLLIGIGAFLLAGARSRAGVVDSHDDETARVPITRTAHVGGGYAQPPDWAHDEPLPLEPEQHHDDATDGTETAWDGWAAREEG